VRRRRRSVVAHDLQPHHVEVRVARVARQQLAAQIGDALHLVGQPLAQHEPVRVADALGRRAQYRHVGEDLHRRAYQDGVEEA
jgi:hypothetical protein